jgi:hypothetical protein
MNKRTFVAAFAAALCILLAQGAYAADAAFVGSREARVTRSGELASKSDVYTIEVGGKAVVIDAAGNLKGTAGLKIAAKDLEIFFITDVQYVSLPDRTILSVDFGNGDYVTGAFYVLSNALDKNPEFLAYSPRIKAGQFASNGKYAFEATHDTYRLIDVDAKKILYERRVVTDGDIRYDNRLSYEGSGAIRVRFYHYVGAERESGTALVDAMTGKDR